MIHLTDVNKRFGDRTRQYCLRSTDVSLEIAEGEILALLAIVGLEKVR